MEMLKAIRSNDDRKVLKKLQKGFDANKQITETNQSKKNVQTIPLCLAAARGYYDIVELLLKYGANINACNYDWSTPLHMATFHGHQQTIRCLLERNVNLNNCDQQGDTVLHLAVLKNNYEAALLFLERELDTEIQNKKGETAIDIARSRGYDHFVNIILEKKKKTHEQVANEDERRVQAKQLITEINQKEQMQRKLHEMEIQELSSSLCEKEEEETRVKEELQYLNQEADSISSQITSLEARLREINQARISKEQLRGTIHGEIEELQKRKNLLFEGSVGRPHSDEVQRNESPEYDCPICFEMPFSPRKVYQCVNGHVYCSECKEKPSMACCPQCRVPLDPNSPIRNLHYEDMLVRNKQKTRTKSS